MLTIAFLDIYSFLPSPFAYLYVSSHEQDMEEQKRTCFEKLIERLIEKLFERLIERLLKAY